MSITDELRTEARGFGRCIYTSEEAHCLLAIADRIDAEHESKVSYWQGASYKDGYDEGFASADDWLAQHEDAMAEHGWVRLPKDADGEYIHIGDVMEWCNGSFTVHELKLTEDGWQTWDSEHGYTVHADECIHHKPTVEDVLWDSLKRFGAVEERTPEVDDWLREQAKRLRLAEEVDG